MKENRTSVARLALLLANTGMVLGFLWAFFINVGPTAYLHGIASGDQAQTGLLAIGLLNAIFLVPLLRGARFGYYGAIVVHFVGALAFVPPFIGFFTKPSLGFTHWANVTFLYWCCWVGAIYGLLALAEARGKRAPAFFSAQAGSLSVQAAALLGAACLLVGSSALAAVTGAPSGGGSAVAAAPEEIVRLETGSMHFEPAKLDLKAGKATAIFVTNTATLDHSFDIGALNIHLTVPAGKTVMAVIKPEQAGTIEFTCDIPGHKEAGMKGLIEVK